MCIHIGDTTAGEIVPFLKERVKTICPLQLQFRIGLQGVKSSQIRDVWVFQKSFPAVPVSLSDPTSTMKPPSKELIEHVMKVTNPTISVQTIKDPEVINIILFICCLINIYMSAHFLICSRVKNMSCLMMESLLEGLSNDFLVVY